MMFEKIREQWERRKTVRTARGIAVNIYMLGGPDLRHMSDDELIEHLTRAHEEMAELVKQAGVSLDEAHDAFSRMGRALDEMQRIPNGRHKARALASRF